MAKRKVLVAVLAIAMVLECNTSGSLLAAEVPTVESEYTQKVATVSEAGDFYIEGEVLTGYKGAGGVVTIPEGITDIGDYAFADCRNITSIIIPEGVTRIGYHAFEGCYNLTSITIPSGMERIKDCAFYSCRSLTSVIIPKSVTNIGDMAFSGCSKLDITVDAKNSLYSSKDGILYNKEQTTLICAAGERTNITIPEGVTSIESNAFYNCYELMSITIPNSVTSIGENAFGNCTSLTSVTIPAGVKSIENNVFGSCYSLTSIIIPEGVTKIGVDAFANCYNLTSVTIPEGVTGIGAQAFMECHSLTSVTIPEGVAYISDEAFANCYNLTSIVIPSSVKDIGDEAFINCSSLMSVKISEGVIRIGARAFDVCSGLSNVLIPRSVTRIGECAFGYGYNNHYIYLQYPDFKISCYRDTAGETYAKENAFEYDLMDCDTHSFGVWETTTPATCEKDGEEQRKCKACGEIEKRTISKVSHVYKKIKTVAATSKKQGYTLYKCSNCESKERRNYTIYIGNAKILGISNRNYTGKQIKQPIKVTYGKLTLKNGRDYKVSYKNNTKVGKATVTITGKGTYSGSVSKNFKILPRKK